MTAGRKTGWKDRTVMRSQKQDRVIFMYGTGVVCHDLSTREA
jgi:hypothetical protein